MLVIPQKKAMPRLFAAVLLLSLCWMVKISVSASAGSILIADSTSINENKKWTVNRRIEYQGYEFRLEQLAEKYGEWETVFEERLRLFRKGVEIFSVADARISLEPLVLTKIGQPQNRSPATVGMDITSDGHPNAIIAAYSGGAHCCYTYYILDIGETYRLVDEINGDDFEIRFQNLDKKPGYELEFWDNNFAYWKTGFGSSPAPHVVLKYHAGSYTPDMTLMRTPPLSGEVFRKLAHKVRHSEIWSRGADWFEPELWRVMLQLIYSGNWDQAVNFLDQAWPTGRLGQKAFQYEFFNCQLRRSQFWPFIAKLNNRKPSKPEINCPPAPDSG